MQTNWWKIEEMSGDEINSYLLKGWIFIPDGTLWGLDPGEYLAYNLPFDCPTGTGGGGGSSNTSSNSVSGSSTTVTSPSLQGVLGIANTGVFTDYLLQGLATVGIVFLILALFLLKPVRRFLGFL